MSDLTNFRISKEANEIATKLVDTGKFDHVTSVAKFALAYAILNYYDKFDPGSFNPSDGDGSNYSIGSFSDWNLPQFIKILYPDTDTPFIYIRNLIIFGLLKLGELIEENGIPDINTLC